MNKIFTGFETLSNIKERESLKNLVSKWWDYVAGNDICVIINYSFGLTNALTAETTGNYLYQTIKFTIKNKITNKILDIIETKYENENKNFNQEKFKDRIFNISFAKKFYYRKWIKNFINIE